MSGPSEKKPAKPGFVPPTGAADLRSRVPGMTDDALDTLLKNARRLVDTGSNAQRLAATDLLPVIEAELAERQAKKQASQPARKARSRKAAPATQDDEAV